MNRRRRIRLLIAVVVIFGLAAIMGLEIRERNRTALRWEAGFLPGNPRRGGELFHDKGCARCHAISGVGGDEAPDLARSGRQAPADLPALAAVMWNHGPDMWDRMVASGDVPPELTPRDTADLMAFLFAAGYLEEGGDPERGRAVLASKKCRQCHATGEREQKTGPDLTQWSSSVNPILWAQLLWNHAPAMEEAMEAEGIPWPQLTSQDVQDLLAFLRRVGNAPRKLPPLPGDPWAGKNLFSQYCRSCHVAEGEGGDVGPDLGASTTERTLAGLAASMWNHAPAMGESMKELELQRPNFSEQEMADLITYLFAIRYFESPGESVSGKQVYLKNCSRCHGEEGEGGTGGPSLRSLGARSSATFMASTLWNHGPKMYEEMKAQNLKWPQFEPNDMRDLIQHLRSLSSQN